MPIPLRSTGKWSRFALYGCRQALPASVPTVPHSGFDRQLRCFAAIGGPTRSGSENEDDSARHNFSGELLGTVLELRYGWSQVQRAPTDGKRMSEIVPTGYAELLGSLKARIRDAQMRASLSVNSEMVLLYWSIGRDILERQTKEGWGARVIDRLAQDLKAEYPAMKGFSPRNLKYMRSFAEAWPEEEIVQGPLAQITWYHNLALLKKIATREQRLWYAQKTTENGWSRNVLALQIDSGLIDRQGKSVILRDTRHKYLRIKWRKLSCRDPFVGSTEANPVSGYAK